MLERIIEIMEKAGRPMSHHELAAELLENEMKVLEALNTAEAKKRLEIICIPLKHSSDNSTYYKLR